MQFLWSKTCCHENTCEVIDQRCDRETLGIKKTEVSTAKSETLKVKYYYPGNILVEDVLFEERSRKRSEQGRK